MMEQTPRREIAQMTHGSWAFCLTWLPGFQPGETQNSTGKMPVVQDRLEAYLPLFFQEREEFGTSARVLFECAEQAGRFHDRVLLLDSAHHHAKMFRFDHDSDAGRFE